MAPAVVGHSIISNMCSMARASPLSLLSHLSVRENNDALRPNPCSAAPETGSGIGGEGAPPGRDHEVLGYGIAVLGVFEALDDIRFDGYDNAGSVIGALVAYAGYAMAFFGARSIEP